MDKKLRILMQNENLTASKLAEILEIKPAAVSHILSGRNKPSFELICKIVNRFPQINPYWLLGDAEEMLNQNAQIQTSENNSEMGRNLFNLQAKNEATPEVPRISENFATAPSSRSDIEKIIIVYNNQTFEELKPKKS